MTSPPSYNEMLRSLWRVVAFRPIATVGIVTLSVLAAVLEGIGLGFLIPIIQLARGGTQPADTTRFGEVFVSLYQSVGVPFTLETVVAGVGVVMIARYTASFVVDWLRICLQTDYMLSLRHRLFDRAISARVAYFDERGSDELVNGIVTQAREAGKVIEQLVRTVEEALLSIMYLGIALFIAPVLTTVSVIALSVMTYVVRNAIEPGAVAGAEAASANERIQEVVQAGIQGIRDIKLFSMKKELFERFEEATRTSARAEIVIKRNRSGVNKLYQLATALTVFGLIYFSLTYASLSLASLGVFLFAMFRLSPRVSSLNDTIYELEGTIPHLRRTHTLLDEMDDRSEPTDGQASPPDAVDRVSFDSVSFSYEEDRVLDDVSFTVDSGEFAAFVGPSGAGKSTIVSLLTRMYEPDSGRILANSSRIDSFPIDAWRKKVSVVRQDPYIFNDTLRYNVTIGNRHASPAEIARVCEIAQVTEFLDELPDGYDTVLGDDGVRLSGGQRQRISIARALLRDAELLILDEATSDLDSTIEERVHSAIESMERDYAMLVIAHRLSTVTNADRIYTLRDGEIVERGTHDDLIANDGTYADLYATQVVQ